MVAGAEVGVGVGKFSASRGADGNIEGLDVDDSAAVALDRPRFFFVVNTNSVEGCDVVFESLGRIENVNIALVAAFFAIFKGPG